MKPTALVIEDHIDQSLVFQKALETAGYDVEVINNGEVAQERLKEVVPTLIVLDLHMPKVSGQMILQQVRADSRLADVKIFLATADSVLADSLSDAADLVLLKPVGFKQLVNLATRYNSTKAG